MHHNHPVRLCSLRVRVVPPTVLRCCPIHGRTGHRWDETQWRCMACELEQLYWRDDTDCSEDGSEELFTNVLRES